MSNAITAHRDSSLRSRRALAPLAALAAIAALAAVPAAPARAALREPAGVCGERAARGDLVDVQVLVEGRPAALFVAPGRLDRRYFQAFRGRHYALRVTNRSGGRVGVLIAVDGLNVVSGDRSRLGGDESLYVLGPRESATIRGWRTSLDQVRAFVFVDEERSYASRSGQANGDLGWIRVLAFAERRPYAWLGEPSLRRADEPGGREPSGTVPESRPLPAPAPRDEQATRADKALAFGPVPESGASPGTGWGERRRDPVRETWFVPAAAPTDHLVFRYEYASGLRALGIELGGERLWERERGELGFAQPPRW